MNHYTIFPTFIPLGKLIETSVKGRTAALTGPSFAKRGVHSPETSLSLCLFVARYTTPVTYVKLRDLKTVNWMLRFKWMVEESSRK